MDFSLSGQAWDETENSAPGTQPKTNKYVCSTCGRAYKAKESLTRHEENHTGATKHVCKYCGIGFHRRDLLSRHARVHATARTKRSSDSRSTGRQRTHRACDGCRASKTKCDSGDPCGSCDRRGHQCTYAKPPQRLSQANQTERIATSHDSPTPSPSASSTTSEANLSHLDQLGNQEMHNTEFGDGGANSLQQHDGLSCSATNGASNAFAMYGAPVTGVNTNPHEMASVNIDQPSASAHSSHDIPLLSPVLQMDFNQFWQSNGLSQPFSWPWLFEESYLQQPSALTDVPMLGEFVDNSMFDNSQAEFRPCPPNPSIPSTASLTAFGNSAVSGEQETMEQVVQSSFEYPAGARLESTSGFQGNAQYGLTQANLDMDLTEAPFDSFLATRADNQQATAASSVRDGSHNTMTLERKRQVVRKIVDATFQDSSGSKPSSSAQQHRSQMWNMFCPDIEQAFSITKNETSSMTQPHILHEYVALYFKHFNRLWPLIWQHGLNFDDIPGPIYLTLAMIGSMYAGGNAPAFGFMVHEYISTALMLAPTWRLDADDVTYSTCRSLLLTQVASLYFGTKKAFSCAQQLGSVLVSLARKIGLLNRSWASKDFEDEIDRNPTHRASLVSRWIENESRKRLVFGIFRADTFLSLLLNTRPLLSYEEIFLGMPCPNSVWHYSARDLQAYIKMSATEDDTRLEVPFSDLVQIAMDRAEPLPALKSGEYELLVFALQQSVWRFSNDPDIFQRLIGRTPGDTLSKPANHNHDIYDDYLQEHRDISMSTSDPRSKSSSAAYSTDLDDALDWSRRRMADLQLDYERTLCALKKWKQSFAAASTSAQAGHDRDLLLSSRLLYHLSFIRLNAEVEAFHLLTCKRAAYKRHQRDTLRRVHQWSRFPAAQVAVEHACSIWTVVKREIRRTEDCRARFNIIAFISLHHAASVIWAYAGTRDLSSVSSGSGSGSKGAGKGSTNPSSAARREQLEGIQSLEDVDLCRANTHTLLTRFAVLLRNVSSAWVAVSAFSTTVALMADNPLPLLDC